MQLSRTVAAGLTAVCLAPMVAVAQDAPGHLVSLGILAGGTLPVGGISRLVYDPGYHVGGLAEVRLPVQWLRLRVDGGYQHFDGGRQSFIDATGTILGFARQSTDIFSGSAGVTLRVPGLRSAVQPYAVGGYGMYRIQGHLKAESGSVPSVAGSVFREHGANAGLGLDARLGRTIVFAEAQYQRIGPQLRMMPLSLGVRTR